MPILRHWQLTDELPTPPPPLAADDGDWWAGAQRCFAGVAIAGAAAALSLASGLAQAYQQQNEDIVPAVAAPSSGGLPFYGQREAVRTSFLRWGVSDDWIPAATPLPVDEAYWQPPRYTPPPLDLRVWRDDSDRLQPAAFSPDIDIAPPAAPTLIGATYVVWAEDEPVIPVPRFSEDHWTPPLPQAPGPIARVWAVGDEIVTPATPLPVDEAYWQAEQYWPAKPDLRLWAADIEIAQAAAPLTVDESYWHQHRAPLQAYAPPPAAQDAEDMPAQPVALDDSGWSGPTPFLFSPVACVWVDQDEIETPPVPLAADEDFWHIPRAFLVPAFAPVFLADDEAIDFVAPPAPAPTGPVDAKWPKKKWRYYTDEPRDAPAVEPKPKAAAAPASPAVAEPPVARQKNSAQILERVRALAQQRVELAERIAHAAEQAQAEVQRRAADLQREEQRLREAIQQAVDDEQRAIAEDNLEAATRAASLLLGL